MYHCPCAPYPLYPIAPCALIAHMPHCRCGPYPLYTIAHVPIPLVTIAHVPIPTVTHTPVPHTPCTPLRSMPLLPICPITHVPHLDLDPCFIKEHTYISYMLHVPLDPQLVTSWGSSSNVSKCQKMSSCQKDVKCQKVKHWTMEEVIKINWHNEVHRYWHQFWHHIWWSLKTFKMSIESIFDQFWWPSYVTSKLMSISAEPHYVDLFFYEPLP